MPFEPEFGGFAEGDDVRDVLRAGALLHLLPAERDGGLNIEALLGPVLELAVQCREHRASPFYFRFRLFSKTAQGRL